MDEDKFKYWLELAEYDLETAKAMPKTGRYIYVGAVWRRKKSLSL